MQITLNMLLVKLKEHYPNLKIPAKGSVQSHHIQGIRILPEKKNDLKQNYLYVCDSVDVRKLELWDVHSEGARIAGDPNGHTFSPDEILFQTDMQESFRSDILLLETDMGLASLFNDLQEIYAWYQNWDRSMHESLIQNTDFQELIRISNPVLNNPVLIYDLSLKLLNYSEEHMVQDEIFSKAVEEGYLSPGVLRQFEKAGVFDQKEKNKVFIFRPEHTDSHLTMYLPFQGNEKITGYCVMLLYEPENLDYYKTMFQNFYEYANLCMQQIQRSIHTDGFIYEYALLDLLNNEAFKEEVMKEHLEYIGLPFASEFYLFAVPLHHSGTTTVHFLLHQLQMMFPEARVFEYDSNILILIYENKSIDLLQYRQQIPGVFAKLKNALQQHGLQCAVSMPFYKITQMKQAYEQTVSALQLHEILQTDFQTSDFVFFENYLIYDMCSCLLAPDFKKQMIPPALIKIMAHDVEKQTCYAELLRTFLNENCRISETAEKLHMHRNNVVYHIRRMENRYHLQLDHPEERLKLELAFYCLELSKRNSL